jgi:hypothetical protein
MLLKNNKNKTEYIYLPPEIIAHISKFMDNELQVIKLWTSLRIYKNSPYLPYLKNYYSYFNKDQETTKRILAYGFRLNISCDYSIIGHLVTLPKQSINNIIKLRLYIKSKTCILRNNIYLLKNLEEIELPYCCIDFNIKKLPYTLKIYKYYDNKNIINVEKYNKLGIRCINYFK